jgi:hypothetical protein
VAAFFFLREEAFCNHFLECGRILQLFEPSGRPMLHWVYDYCDIFTFMNLVLVYNLCFTFYCCVAGGTAGMAETGELVGAEDYFLSNCKDLGHYCQY